MERSFAKEALASQALRGEGRGRQRAHEGGPGAAEPTGVLREVDTLA